MSSPPDVPTEHSTGDPGPPSHRRPIGALAVAAISLAVAMLIVTVMVQLAADGTPDVAEVLEGGASSSEANDSGAQRDALLSAPVAGPELGDPSPEVALDWLGGGTTQLSELRGAPVLVNFWSSSCAPCRSEMPAFEAVHRSLGTEVTFVGVDVTDTEAAGLDMVERTGVSYRNARDPRGEVLAAFGGTALPRTVLLDAEGSVVGEHSGAFTEAELRALLSEHGIG